MPLNLFGFTFRNQKQPEVPRQSFAPPSTDDGEIVLQPGAASQSLLDLEGNSKTESDLIGRYRDVARLPEVDAAINEIVNESIVTEEYQSSVSLVTDKLTYKKDIIVKIQEEFENVLNLLDWNNEGSDIFRRWYVDGRLYFHIIIDDKNPREGIKELRAIDPRDIKPVIEIEEIPNPDGTILHVERQRYYMYSRGGLEGIAATRIAWDSICYVHSGIHEANTNMILGHLNKAIKPANMLTMTEDATVIYRLSRAPERRIFYIDTGTLPTNKAEQYVKSIMAQYRNKMVYDASTGEVRDDKKFLSFMEDYWLPRKEGGRGTEITTLRGGENLGVMTDVEYFKEKLYQSLNVPIGRIRSDSGFSIGRATEINRDEIKFGKFIARLRNRFTQIFDVLLKTQLMLKGIIAKEDWQVIRQKIFYDFLQDTYFSELKDKEILRERLIAVDTAIPYVGKYVSHKWIRQYILKQTDLEIEALDQQMYVEKSDPRYQAIEAMNDMGSGGMIGSGDEGGQYSGGPNDQGGQYYNPGDGEDDTMGDDEMATDVPATNDETLDQYPSTRNLNTLWSS